MFWTQISNNLTPDHKLKYSWAMSGKADIATPAYGLALDFEIFRVES